MKSKNGTVNQTLTVDTLVRDWMLRVAKECNLPHDRLSVAIGYPAVECDVYTMMDKPISTILKTGDVINVSESSACRTSNAAVPITESSVKHDSSSRTDDKDARQAVIISMPDDNSCMFRAVTYVCSDSDVNACAAPAMELREIVAACILSNPEQYNEV